MSANHSLLLFEGDLTPVLPELFQCFGYMTTGTVEYAKGLHEIWEFTAWPRKGHPRNTVHKGVLYNGTWTAVLDREMAMVLDQEKCTDCAKHFNVKIFAYLIENVSDSCALYMYSPEKIRGLNIQNREILEDFGEPLPQEAGISTSEMLGDGVMRVSRRLGFSDALFAHPASRVQIVGMEDPLRTQAMELLEARRTNHGQRPKPEPRPAPVSRIEKPWWKLW